MEDHFSEKDVLAQLNKILKADLFKASKVLSHFLKFIVTEKLKGRESDLKEYRIAVKGLGMSASFDPKNLANIRIYAIRLRHLLYQYYSTAGVTDPIRISIPKGGYKPVFKPNINEAGIESATNENTLYLAVLPFLKTGSYTSHALINTLCEQISIQLAAGNELAVVAYSFVRLYISKQKEEDNTHPHFTGVQLYVTGSVRTTPALIIANIQLVAAHNGVQLWAKEFEASRGSALISMLAQNISRSLLEVLATQKETLLSHLSENG